MTQLLWKEYPKKLPIQKFLHIRSLEKFLFNISLISVRGWILPRWMIKSWKITKFSLYVNHGGVEYYPKTDPFTKHSGSIRFLVDTTEMTSRSYNVNRKVTCLSHPDRTSWIQLQNKTHVMIKSTNPRRRTYIFWVKIKKTKVSQLSSFNDLPCKECRP